MGWFFKKKKKALDVPVPMRKIDENAFSFNDAEKKLEVASLNLKKVAGVGNSPVTKPKNDALVHDPFITVPDTRKPKQDLTSIPKPVMRERPDRTSYAESANGFVFLKVEQYKRILGELDASHDNLNHLGNISRKLYQSEFNEERNFARLKNTIRSVHDKFLTVDKTIFKS